VAETLDELVTCLDHPALPLLQWSEEYSFVEGRLPPGITEKLEEVITQHEVCLLFDRALSGGHRRSEVPQSSPLRARWPPTLLPRSPSASLAHPAVPIPPLTLHNPTAHPQPPTPAGAVL
jgi:hypothetical protein